MRPLFVSAVHPRRPGDDVRALSVLLSLLLCVSAAGKGARGGPSEFGPPVAAVVDVNAATADEIGALPGIGPVLAARIVVARREGPFRDVAAMSRAHGVGPVTRERIAPHAVFGDGDGPGSRPRDPERPP